MLPVDVAIVTAASPVEMSSAATDPATPPDTVSATHLAPSHFRNWPLDGESWPIFVTFPEPSNVIAAVPPASLRDPPSSIMISPLTVTLSSNVADLSSAIVTAVAKLFAELPEPPPSAT